MPGQWAPDALVEQKMGQTKREMMEYIEKNSEKIDSNRALCPSCWIE